MGSAIMVVVVFTVLAVIVGGTVPTYNSIAAIGEEDELMLRPQAIGHYLLRLPYNSLSLGVAAAVLLVTRHTEREMLLKAGAGEIELDRWQNISLEIMAGVAILMMGSLCIISFMEFVADKRNNKFNFAMEYVRPVNIIAFFVTSGISLFLLFLISFYFGLQL